MLASFEMGRLRYEDMLLFPYATGGKLATVVYLRIACPIDDQAGDLPAPVNAVVRIRSDAPWSLS